MINFWIKTVAFLGVLCVLLAFGSRHDAFLNAGCLLIGSALIAGAIRSNRDGQL